METPFTPEEALAYIRLHAGEDAIISVQTDGLQSAWELETSKVLQVCGLLHQTPGLWFDMLACLSAIDDRDMQRYGVVVHLTSLVYEQQLVLKYYQAATGTPQDSENKYALPEFPSLSGVWPAAIWHEREAYDLMGLWFTGHPDMRRILLPEDWEGYPLRKDYTAAETYHQIKIKY